jgi:hypothetical protein
MIMKITAGLLLTCISACAPATVQNAKQSSLDVRDFGAACDNRTDDSAALQKAINEGVTKGLPVNIPGGTCIHKSTLTMNSGHTSVRLTGTPFQSGLKYSGTGSGWVWKNGDGKQFIYNSVVTGVSFFCGNSSGCAKGIEAYSLSEAVFRDIDIAQSDGVFATSWFCSGCNIMDLDHLVLSANSKGATPAVGFDCAGCAAVIIHAGDFYYFPTATLRFSGPSIHIVVDGNWFEAQDTAILFDDSAPGGAISSDLISILNNRFVFNGASAAKDGNFHNQTALRINNSAAKAMTMTGVLFGPGNSVFCAAGLCNAPTPIVISVSQTTSSSTAIDLTVRDNVFRGASAGIVTSNSSKVAVYFENNRSRDQAGRKLASEVVGTNATVTPK